MVTEQRDGSQSALMKKTKIKRGGRGGVLKCARCRHDKQRCERISGSEPCFRCHRKGLHLQECGRAISSKEQPTSYKRRRIWTSDPTEIALLQDHRRQLPMNAAPNIHVETQQTLPSSGTMISNPSFPSLQTLLDNTHNPENHLPILEGLELGTFDCDSVSGENLSEDWMEMINSFLQE